MAVCKIVCNFAPSNKTNYFVMKNKLLFTAILLIACVISLTTHAQQVTPEISIEMEPNRYIIHFVLPPYWFEEDDGHDNENGIDYGEDVGCDVFTKIKLDAEHDVTDVPGYPELPFFSLDLLLPFDAHDLVVSHFDGQFHDEYVDHYVRPALKGTTINFSNNTLHYIVNDEDPCLLDSYYYTNGATDVYPNGFYRDFYTISNIRHYLYSTGFTLSIFPFSYYPEQGYIQVLTEGTIIVDFSGDDVNRTMDDYVVSTEYSSMAVAMMYDNFNELIIDPNHYDGPKYLIIAAHRDMEYILSEYVSYKQGQNYNVGVVYLDEESRGNNNIAIRNIIEDNATLTNPDFVLLVGSLGDIPPYQGLNHPDNPYTDDDYHPFLGRWIVTGEAGYYPELERIIQKTISSEQAFARAQRPSSAVLFSGRDASNCTASRVFYNRIKRIDNVSFDRMGIPSTLYDGRYSNVTFNSMCQSLGSHPSFFIYSGHGTSILNSNQTFIVGSAIDAPYLLCPSNLMVSRNNVYFDHISSLQNTSPFPMGFGFACSLNTYETNNNFAARWISEPYGGATFYGATTVSYRGSNNYLSKIMFRTLRKTKEQCGNFALATWLRTGEQKYYNALRNGSRWTQIQKYNLMGDPTFHVFGRESDGTIAPFHVLQKRTDIDSDSEIESVEVYNIYGQLVQSCKSLDFIIDKNNSLYIYKVTYTNGLTKTYKVL